MRKSVHDQTMFFRVNAALAASLRAKAEEAGASPSEYLRELVRRDLRHAAQPRMLSRRGRSDHKREEAGRRIPTMPQMGHLGLDERTLREGSLFGEGLIRDVENWHLREARRLEGVHSPGLDRAAREYVKAHKTLSMPRARLLAALFPPRS